MSEKDKIFENLLQEFKRGTLVFTVLLNVGKPSYGYSLIKKLQDCGVNIEQNTLYPLLRRLEKQNLLTSYWDTSESRPRKYYQISETGEEILKMKIVLQKYIHEKINRVQFNYAQFLRFLCAH